MIAVPKVGAVFCVQLDSQLVSVPSHRVNRVAQGGPDVLHIIIITRFCVRVEKILKTSPPTLCLIDSIDQSKICGLER